MTSTFDERFHAKIQPVPSETHRPLWSVVIPTYHCAAFLKEAIESVLCQDLGEKQMEILVVDDHSVKDHPEEIVHQFGKNRVRYFQQPQNVGKAANYATGINLSSGHLIHLLHGDDLALPGFYKEMETLFENNSAIGAGFCQSNYINEKGETIGKTGIERETPGVLENWLQKIAINQRIQPPSIVIKRAVYEKLGGYDSRLRYMEDWEFYIRIANTYPMAFTPSILSSYRVHKQSSSQTSILKGGRLSTLQQILSISDQYLNPNIVKTIKTKRNRAQAYNLIRNIPTVLVSKDYVGYCRMVKAILGYSMHPRVLYHLWFHSIHSKKLFSA